jgi:hypothetical protein
VRTVERHLIAGVGVDRCHQPLREAKGVVQHFGHRGDAVSRARGTRDHVVLLRIVVCVIDPDDQSEVCAFARSQDQDLARATLQVQRRVVAAAELAGGLDHHVDAEVAPADGRRLRTPRAAMDLPLTMIEQSVCATSAANLP